jgi:dipeptidyl aminopeptidase/acylaminoacyl peptidase
VKKVDTRKVAKFPIVHWLNPPEEVEWFHKALTGGPIGQTELFIVDVLSKRKVRVDTGEESDQYIWILGWRPDGSELFFLRTDRLLKKLDLMAADPATGSTRVVVTETQKTFVGTHRGNYTRVFTPLWDGKKFIWMSERDRWNHLYLYDMDGNLIRRLTEGSFPVSGRNNERWLVAVDEKAGWVYFTAYGDQQRPYDTHLYRVNLEGKGFTRLTEATGRHAIQFSPSKEFFLDTHSTPTRPPVVELRRADGTLLQTLSPANIDALQELQWRPPEEFVVKATDGKTDLYGVLYKPYDFDPNKKYPVIEVIYAWPGGNTVSHTFTPYSFSGVWAQALAQLGFVTFVVDARGTPKRGKEFWDVVYGNLGRHEIPDHVATLKQLAAQRPYMDLGQVGIYGYSAGGYFTLRAMLLAPDVYHVGIAGAPPVDAYGWAHLNERLMGLPEKNKQGYEYASNLRLAGNLKGKLLIIHPTSDVNIPFSQTMKMVEALIRAGKPYDLLVFPEQNHSPAQWSETTRRYMQDAIRRYFQEYLKP